MRKAEDVMSGFMENWCNMKQYQNIRLDTCLNAELVGRAFWEEKKIVKTYEGEQEEIPKIEDKSRRLTKKQ